MVDTEFWKPTMDLYSKLIEKPKMQEKLLRKPPPRYVYDILIATMGVTGYPKGLYTEEETSPKYFDESPQNKLEIFQKTIEITKIVLNEKFEIKTTNILKGEEPEKTNYFLQAFYKAATSGKDFSKFIQKYLDHKKKKKEEVQKEEGAKEIKENKENQEAPKIVKKPTLSQEKVDKVQPTQQIQEMQAPTKFEKQTTLPSSTANNNPESKSLKAQPNSNTNVQPNSQQPSSNNTTNTNKQQQAEKPKLVRPESAMKRPEKINSDIKEVKEDATKTNKKAPQGLIKDSKKIDDLEEKTADSRETKMKTKDDDLSAASRSNNKEGTIKIEKINKFEDKLFGETEKNTKFVINIADLEAIKNFVQDITKNVNPTTKIVDFLYDDIESMNKELQSYVKESKTYKERHDEEVRKSDEELLSLQNELLELEETIKDEHIRIKSIKTRLIKNENIIQSLINNVISIKNDK